MATTGIDTSSLALSGLASGFDWQSFITQMVAAERAPETTMRSKQTTLQQKNSAFTTIKSSLTTLQAQINALKDPTLYDSRTAQVSDSTIASATAATGAVVGAFTFNISNLATASTITGASNASGSVLSGQSVSSQTLANIGFSSAVTAGTFTVDDQQVTIATSDTLQDVFDKIATATNNQVTASYDSSANQIVLSSADPITLGNGADTSNFLQSAQLTANGTGSVSSSSAPLNVAASVPLSQMGFPASITAGTVTVNGQQVTIATTDTLQQVLDKIATATNSLPETQRVSASYSASTDKITLSSSGEIVLGSATDTSNFLQAARLYNNTTGTISSAIPLGSVLLSAGLTKANLAASITDGGSGAGQFKINNVTINFSTSDDSVSDVLNRINTSEAGVTATYDTVNKRFVLTSKATGDMGIALQDVTGNFLAATGLTGGTLNHGKNLSYSIDGGATLTSQSNTITDASSGLTGVSVTALKANSSVTVTTGSDTSKIQTAIQTFVSAYNKVQSYIATQTTSSTNSSGKVTAGLLASDGTADAISNSLRNGVFSSLSGLTGTFNALSALGYQTNGYDNQLALSDSSQLSSALGSNLANIKTFFSDSTNGLCARLNSLLDKLVGDDGTLVTHQASLTKQSNAIDTQIANLEKTITADQKRMTKEFLAMETAQSKINQQSSYLTKYFGSSSS